MLPPVRATLSSSAEYQNPPQQPAPRQRLDVATGGAAATLVSSTPLSGGRLDILSLSGQLQLAQGFSVFAETIGKLIKLPRQEGEALPDYAKRLSEAVAAMSPAEKAALQRALNQMVKGVMLRLLIEVLSDPTGPDAARFAMRMEAAQLRDRDLAAKAVVSSYRQNAGIEQAVTPVSGRPVTTTATPGQNPVETGKAASEGEATKHAGETPFPTGETADTEGAEPSAGGRKAPSQASGPATSTVISSAAGKPASSETATASAPLPGKDGLPSIGASAGNAAEAASGASQSETPDLPSAAVDERPDAEGTVRHDADAVRKNIAQEPQSQRLSRPLPGDGPNLARLLRRSFEQQAVRDILRNTSAGNQGSAAILSHWLAEMYGAEMAELPELRSTPAPRSLPEQQAAGEFSGGETRARASSGEEHMQGSALSNPPGSSPLGADSQSPSAKAAVLPPQGNGQSAGASPDPAETALLPLALPHILREGVPLPYVPYPTEERERDPEERKTRAISPTDEDGEQPHSQGDQGFKEDAEPESHREDAADGASGEDAAEDGQADDFYWRMAGWA